MLSKFPLFQVNSMTLDMSTGRSRWQEIAYYYFFSSGSHPTAFQYILIHLVYTNTSSFTAYRKSVTHYLAALSIKYWSVYIVCMSSTQTLKYSNHGCEFLCRLWNNATGILIGVFIKTRIGRFLQVQRRVSTYLTPSEPPCEKKCKLDQKLDPNLSTKVLSSIAPP